MNISFSFDSHTRRLVVQVFVCVGLHRAPTALSLSPFLYGFVFVL